MSVSTRYRNDWGEMVPDPEGQWQHVKDAGIEGWKLDIPLPAARAAAPPVEQEAAAHRPPGGHDTIPPSPDPVAGLREADQETWRQRIVEHLGPQRMSLYMGKDIDRMATGAVIAVALLASDKPGLDAAWAEIEALTKGGGWLVEFGRRDTIAPMHNPITDYPVKFPGHYFASASREFSSEEGPTEYGDTPAAALRALAARIREREA